MKATELRLGNWIQQDGKPYTLDTSTMIDVFAHWQEFEEMLFQPVPLTEQWLLKFGFEKFKTGNYGFAFRNANLEIIHSPEIHKDYYLDIEDCIPEEKGNLVVDLKYVHQLQNLYFALTGEELEIKVPA